MRALLALAVTLPHVGVLVPGTSLGGIRLGETKAQVERAWGREHGTCRNCPAPTWYFNVKRFEPVGAGVSFRQGRVERVFTLWAPPGWHTSRDLTIGDPEARATSLYGVLLTTTCVGYDALALPHGAGTIFVKDGVVWGFALSRPGLPTCLEARA